MKRKIRYVLYLTFALLIVTSVFSCKDDKNGLTSAEGKWTYTTSDGKMSIDFELVKTTSGSFDIQNQILKVDGTACNTEKTVDGLIIPSISSMRFHANDAKVTYPYYILFTNASVSNDFTRIEVTSAEYTFPWGTTKKLSNILISRP